MFVAVAAGYGFFGFREMTVLRAIAAQYTEAELAYAQYNGEFMQEAPAAAQHSLTVAADEETAAAAAAAAAAETGTKAGHPTKSPQRSPPPPLRWLTPTELFAKELQLSVRGMPSAIADALASTTALGGVRHSSLAGLKQWLAADEGNEELLRAFLHEGKHHSTVTIHRTIMGV
jgi:hypothetical protein